MIITEVVEALPDMTQLKLKDQQFKRKLYCIFILPEQSQYGTTMVKIIYVLNNKVISNELNFQRGNQKL